ncbi:MAG: CvpA family protein [Candidatus Dormiibacterota bacterium]
MSTIDIAILVILGLALLTGWWRGLFRPLIVWAFIVAGVVIGFGHPSIADRLAPTHGWAPVMGVLVVVASAVAGMVVARLLGGLLYRRLRILGTVDHLGGAVVSGGLALVAIFILLSGLVAGQDQAPLGFLRSLNGEMAQSRVAPVIFDLGQRLPYLGDGQQWPSSWQPGEDP